MLSESVFQSITNAIADAVIMVDENAIVLFWNPGAQKAFGYSAEETIGKSIHDLIVPDAMCLENKENIRFCVKTFAETGMGYFTISRVELIALRKDGSKFPAELSISPMKISGKWHAVGVVKDISKRKMVEQKQRDAEERYHAFFSQSPLGVLVLDPETSEFIEFNSAAHMQLGYSKEEFKNLHMYDIEAMENGKEIQQHLARLARDKEGEYETEHRTKSGEIRNILVSTKTVRIADKTYLYCILHDITEIRKVQNDLMESEVQYRQLVEAAQEGVWVLDDEIKTQLVNPRLVDMLGYKQNEMIGKKLYDFISPNSIQKAQEYFGDNQQHQPNDNLEVQFLRKDNSPLYANITTSKINNDEGSPLATLALVTDITVRKQMEKELEKYSQRLEGLVEQKTNQLAEVQAQVLKSERLAAIGELAGMVGHDLRNPLAGIKNAVYLLKKKNASQTPQTVEMLETIQACVEKSNKIINDLLEYSRELHLDRAEISVSDLIQEVQNAVKTPPNIKVYADIPQESVVYVDKEKIERVFINLLKNAIDAMPNGGTVTISGKEADGNLELMFADTGSGIPREIMNRLFTPLFTTKAQGMGFGLAICKRIVEAHKGQISVKSSNRNGTVFLVTIPIEPKLEVGGEKIWINQ